MKNKSEPVVLRAFTEQELIDYYSNFQSVDLSESAVISLFDFSITGYYRKLISNLIRNDKKEDAIRLIRSILPLQTEVEVHSNIIDPIGEEPTANGISLISYIFKNRVLLSINNRCPVYCRYCFRRRKLGKNHKKIMLQDILMAIDKIKEMIQAEKERGANINEIILSGGEPLVIKTSFLEKVVYEINKIEEIKTCRIDTKILSVNPYAITPALIDSLSSLKTAYLINHFIHPSEITRPVKVKIDELMRNGILVGAHIPIIKGVNDNYNIIKSLIDKLYQNRVRPYYLIHFIPTKWTEHFRIPLEYSLAIKEKLNNESSGYSLPSLIVYLPNAKGKAIINSKRDMIKTNRGYFLYNTNGEEVFYEEPI